MKIETVLVVGAIGAIGFFVWRRSRSTSSAPLGTITGDAAWFAHDPLGWLIRDPIRIAEKEEELL